jgi:hypothetical protein
MIVKGYMATRVCDKTIFESRSLQLHAYISRKSKLEKWTIVLRKVKSIHDSSMFYAFIGWFCSIYHPI